MANGSRRHFLITGGSLVVGAATAPGLIGAQPRTEAVSPPPLDNDFPHQDAELVREVVGASHRSLDRVRELVTAQPALAKASWDWGFGDWESALGAASHTGRREIALLLMEHGARANIFTAAMLGQLDVVKAMVTAMPGIQRTLGPHSISLLSHARAGGEAAAATARYLESLGDADGEASPALDADAIGTYVGSYRFDSVDGTAGGIIDVADRRGDLMLQAGENAIARGLKPAALHTFYPAGAEAVRIVFTVDGNKAQQLTIHDPEPVVVALRVKEQ